MNASFPGDEVHRQQVDEATLARLRARMVRDQLVARAIHDRPVLTAMAEVPRHEFVPRVQRGAAYEDRPLLIGFEQTISQPLIVATTLQALELDGSETVLDVGAGSGYQAALLSRLARAVYAIELIPELARLAANNLARVGTLNVTVIVGDGSAGWRAGAPYDAIAVAAASPDVPEPLVQQLAEGGRLVIPIGGEPWQELVRIRKFHGRLLRESLGGCAFVPLRGSYGYR
jgi:protein-L-isoaspartate(D-aspartate) O-methyltransferase